MLAYRSSSPSLLKLNARSHRKKYLCPKEYFPSPRRIENRKKKASGNESKPQAPEWDPSNACPFPAGRRARGTVAPALVLTLPPAKRGSRFLRKTCFHWLSHKTYLFYFCYHRMARIGHVLKICFYLPIDKTWTD